MSLNHTITVRSRNNRTKLGNGTRRFHGASAKTFQGRRLIELADQFAEPWGCWADAPPTVRDLCDRAALIRFQIDRLRNTVAAGELIDALVLTNLENALRRAEANIRRLAPKPRPQDALAAHIARMQAAKAPLPVSDSGESVSAASDSHSAIT